MPVSNHLARARKVTGCPLLKTSSRSSFAPAGPRSPSSITLGCLQRLSGPDNRRMSASGTWRTSAGALHVSAFDRSRNRSHQSFLALRPKAPLTSAEYNHSTGVFGRAKPSLSRQSRSFEGETTPRANNAKSIRGLAIFNICNAGISRCSIPEKSAPKGSSGSSPASRAGWSARVSVAGVLLRAVFGNSNDRSTFPASFASRNSSS